jgi:hypothetical protein
MEYVTKRRGGFDEWSDVYEEVTAVIVDGSEYPRRTEEVFVDEASRPLTVEFPPRPKERITIERYEDGYRVWESPSLSSFESSVDEESLCVQTDELEPFSLD